MDTNKNTGIEIPFGAFDSELGGFEYTIPDGFEAGIKDGKVIMRKKESEDDRIREYVIRIVKDWWRKIALVTDDGKFPTEEEMLAYLEKQKEQSITANDLDEEVHRFFDDCIVVHEAKLYGNISERVIPVDCYELTARHFAKWGEQQKEQKPVDIDYISGIRDELLGIEDSAKDIDGLTESQWVAIRAAHRLLGEYIEKEQKLTNDILESSFRIQECLFESSKPLKIKQNKPAEWSEEDKEKLEQCIRLVEGWEKDYDIVKSPYSNFLKSLRPQPHWKPSEEQMGALLWCTAHLGGADHRVLAELYEHLKMYCL